MLAWGAYYIIFCQVLMIIPRSLKRLLRISIKIDYNMLRATTNNNREFYLKWEIPIIYN